MNLLTRLALLTASIFSTYSDCRAQDQSCAYDVCFENTFTVANEALPLRGIAKLRYWGFSVYVSSLHVAKGVDVKNKLGQEKMAFTLHYLRDFGPEDFKKSGLEVMRTNPSFNEQKLSQEIAQMNALYVPIKVGDEYQLTFAQEEGLCLAKNKTRLGCVNNAEFAKYYLGIWLSAYSLKESFTDAMVNES